MDKLLAVVLVLLAGCTGSNNEANLKKELRATQKSLEIALDKFNSCEAKLAMFSDAAQTEPNLESDKVIEYKIGADLVCACARVDPCGMTFWNCEDNKVRACISPITYTTVWTTRNSNNDISCEN